MKCPWDFNFKFNTTHIQQRGKKITSNIYWYSSSEFQLKIDSVDYWIKLGIQDYLELVTDEIKKKIKKQQPPQIVFYLNNELKATGSLICFLFFLELIDVMCSGIPWKKRIKLFLLVCFRNLRPSSCLDWIILSLSRWFSRYLSFRFRSTL